MDIDNGKSVRELIQAAYGLMVTTAAFGGNPFKWPYFTTYNPAAENMLQASSTKEIVTPRRYQ